MNYYKLNAELFDKLKTTDCRAEIIEKNMPLVKYICDKTFGSYNLGSLTMEDLYQEGYIVLMDCIDSFDASKQNFVSYLNLCVFRAIYRVIVDKSGLVRVPQSMLDIREKYNNGETVSDSNKKAIFNTNVALAKPVYLNSTGLDNEGNEVELVDLITSGVDFEELYLNSTFEETFDNLSFLSDREKCILKMHYGLGYYREYSIEEIARSCNASSGRIRQIIVKALSKLRKNIIFDNASGLGDYF